MQVFWAANGEVLTQNLETANSVRVLGTLSLYVPSDIEPPPTLSLDVEFGLDIAFDAEGKQASSGSSFISRLLTPSGLPIERGIGGPGENLFYSTRVLLERKEGAMVGSISTNVPIPNDLPAGTYRLYITFFAGPHNDILGKVHEPDDRSDHQFKLSNEILRVRGAVVALIPRGLTQQPILSPMILANTVNQGGRGIISTDEQNRYQMANRIATQPEVFVVQPRSTGTGELIPYRLEPFFPYLAIGDRDFPITPLVPLDIPGGSLTIKVEGPSGTIEEFGPHPILQSITSQPATTQGHVLTLGGGNPGNILQFTTLSDDFVYYFSDYGRYKITVSGLVSDIWGQEYPFDGEFELWAAETLDLETSALPATPFQVGDELPAVVNIFPGIPAEVEMSFDLYPIDGGDLVSNSINGTANRFGYFDGGGEYFNIEDVGEYLVKVTAKYIDADGRLWIGVRRWGSAVASQSPALIAHGRRGDDTQEITERRAWFSRRSIGIPDGTGSHIFFPYHSGDIFWAVNNDAVNFSLSVQDPTELLTSILEERSHLSNLSDPFQESVLLQELPLVISTQSGIEPTFSISEIDQWGYGYISVQRPGVRVRETIITSNIIGYWRFQDQYLAQRGMGVAGDLQNDLKWMFGAVVFKVPNLGINEVAIYGSLWVEIDRFDSLGSRVFPPFQGAAGGPSGGPIMILNDKEIDLFIMPTAVRPGAILEVGDHFVFAGQVGPPLASTTVKVKATSPGGKIYEINGQSNPIGYFSSPADTFIVDEPGVWTVEVQALHDGLTSAGQVEPPYPTGDVLGSENGSFSIYVVPENTEVLDLGLPYLSFFSRISADAPKPIQLFPRIPDGWTDVEGVYTISMPGFILEQGKLTQEEGALGLKFQPLILRLDYPNIDFTSRQDEDTVGYSDEFFITILLNGTDFSGKKVFAAKIITIVGEDIYDLK